MGHKTDQLESEVTNQFMVPQIKFQINAKLQSLRKQVQSFGQLSVTEHQLVKLLLQKVSQEQKPLQSVKAQFNAFHFQRQH